MLGSETEEMWGSETEEMWGSETEEMWGVWRLRRCEEGVGGWFDEGDWDR